MLDQKRAIDSNKMKLQALFVWGKDIGTDGKKGVPGVDYPADPSLLSDWG